MDERIHLTAATVVANNDCFLLVKENIDGCQVINQPAGHVVPGEDIVAAAVRETLEETGWIVKPFGFLGFSTYYSKASGITYYRASFCAEPVREDPLQPIDDQIDEILWLSSSEIHERQSMLRSPMVLDCIEQYERQHIFSLDLFKTYL
jgi:8-oxo-dGTP pyrophosphatase MutT (NUDIX family)